MRIVFLDIDGVLNYPRIWGQSAGPDPEQAICGILTKRVSAMVEATDAYVVICSTWRRGYSLARLQQLLALRNFENATTRIVDVTPVLNRPRQDEIVAWLDDHPDVTHFVILDDDTAEDGRWDKVIDHWVKPEWGTGISEKEIEQARQILQGHRSASGSTPDF